jgi:hypothetical protein
VTNSPASSRAPSGDGGIPWSGGFLGRATEGYAEVSLTTKFFLSVSDVLSGRIDLDHIDATYVVVANTGILTAGFFERLMEAVNYMAKYGWRLRACLERTCIMEKPGTA